MARKGKEPGCPRPVGIGAARPKDRAPGDEPDAALVPPLPNGNPDATPFVGSLSYDFVPPAAGAYKIECLTPKDVDNFIDEKITVSAPH